MDEREKKDGVRWCAVCSYVCPLTGIPKGRQQIAALSLYHNGQGDWLTGVGACAGQDRAVSTAAAAWIEVVSKRGMSVCSCCTSITISVQPSMMPWAPRV